MRKIRNIIYIILAVYMLGINCIACFASEADAQGYYLLYTINAEGEAVLEVGEKQAIEEGAYSETYLDNLILFPVEAGVFHPFQMEEMKEDELRREIREYLLYAGYARIADETIAEDYELAAQEHAVENSLGGWNAAAEEPDDPVLQKGFNGVQEKSASANEENFVVRKLLEFFAFFKQLPIWGKVLLCVVVFIAVLIVKGIIKRMFRK